MSTRVLRKNLSDRINQQLPIFILGPPPYFRSEWSKDVEIWYTGTHVYYGHM